MHALERAYARRFSKPDGRALWLFGRAPVSETILAVSPTAAQDDAPSSPHLRWDPFREEWVAYASHRQARTFHPGQSPLAPTQDPAHPTELPSGGYDVAVFENRFPALRGDAGAPPPSIVETRAGLGVCEVVVYAKDERASLATLPLWHVELVIAAWAHRTRELGDRSDVAHVFPFENRGAEVGATLSQPHGQIYAYPFVPPVPARMLVAQAAHFARVGRGLMADHVLAERLSGARIVFDDGDAVAFVPAFARFAFETWVVPTRPAARLPDLSNTEVGSLARALKAALLKLDARFGRPMPYVLVVHQAPADGVDHPEAHVHVQIYPFLRMENRLKVLAGSEIGAGVFTADTLPEQKAAELRSIVVDVGAR